MPTTRGMIASNRQADETSSLLTMRPSPASTDEPSKAGTDASYQQTAEHRRLLEVSKGSDSFLDGPSNATLFGVNRRLLTGAVAVVLLALGALVFPWNRARDVIPPNIPSGHGFSSQRHIPLSSLHPVADLGLTEFNRSDSLRPPYALSKGSAAKGRSSFPTNAWYQNLLMMDGEPSSINRVYPGPFLVDTTGPIPGLRVHPNHIDASTAVVQLNIVEAYGLTVGAAADATVKPKNSTYSNSYVVENMTPLGVTVAFESFPMSTSIVKGMPYGTMRYDEIKTWKKNGDVMMPTVISQMGLVKKAVVDGKKELACGSSKNPKLLKVEREVEMHFKSSDFTWLVFFSEPATVQCVVDDETNAVSLQVVELDSKNSNDDDASPFFIRIALSNLCSSNMNPINCHQEQMITSSLNLGQGRYDDVLRNHSHLIPGPNTSFDYVVDESKQQILYTFDWDVKDMTDYSTPPQGHDINSDLLVFALPHHLDLLGTEKAPGYLKYCATTLIGPACLLSGPSWSIVERLPTIAFRAPRPPATWAIGRLAESLNHDIHYTVPKYYQRGAGDTYFSGKMLAKLGRILVIAQEVRELCDESDVSNGYEEVCDEALLPSDADIDGAVASLKSSVEIWLNGTAETPFVFDSAWGGVVSCGCDFNGTICKNTFPDCPAFSDPGLNFGNAFYNDLHFHYGYHIYGAAVAAHFDPEWGMKMFERVLLLVRNIANPTDDDELFPAFRHKDWYQGHSWASGLATNYLNGRNQESSSEAIAAYEAVALYGAVMTPIWEKAKSPKNMKKAKAIREAGQLLTATEIRSTRRYYHVRDNDNENQALKVYPSEYNHHAIGMLWQTMAQFQTWFGSAPYLAIGIQLLPLTPIAEQRDGLQWSMEMYPSLAESCAADKTCRSNGWSVLQLGILATVGHPKAATKDANTLDHSVFTSAGGNGHSLSNTLWYMSTRPTVEMPLTLHNATAKKAFVEINALGPPPSKNTLKDCYRPGACIDYVLDTIADEYSCRQRITWLMDTMGHSEMESCAMVGGKQFPKQCGACNPNATDTSHDFVAQCPPCTIKQCESELNRCPDYPQTFVCTDGSSHGGCSRFPWDLRGTQCEQCCELTECPKTSDEESNCPLCTRSQCRSSVNECGEQSLRPFLCTDGPSESDCSTQPWSLATGECKACCKVTPDCEK